MKNEKTSQSPKQACAGLAESFDIYSSIADILLTTGADNKITSVNTAACKALGYEPGDLIGKSFDKIISEIPKAEETQTQFEKIYSGREEKRLTAKDGRKLDVLISEFPLRSYDNNTEGRIYLARDITRYKQASMVAAEVDQKYKQLFDSTSEGILITDRQGMIVSANPALTRMLGHKSYKQLIGRPIIELYYDHWERECLYRELKKTGWVKEYEVALAHRNGTPVYVLGSVIVRKDKNGRAVQSECIFTNITEMKAAVEKIRHSETMFRSFFENIPEYCYMISNEGKILDINSSALTALEYNKDELLEAPVISIYAESCHAKVKTIFDQWRKTSLVNDEELIIVSKNGKERTVLLNARALKGKDGEILHSVSIQKDITILKKTYEALEKNERELTEKNVQMEEKNIALRQVMDQVKQEKEGTEKQIMANVDRIIIPLIKKLKLNDTGALGKYLDILEDNINNITSAFGNEMSKNLLKLTQKEIEICNMMKSGMSSKDIAGILHTSHRTVETHRNTIRKKLGLTKQNVNLVTYLKSI